jgi:hypothetical protein
MHKYGQVSTSFYSSSESSDYWGRRGQTGDNVLG